MSQMKTRTLGRGTDRARLAAIRDINGGETYFVVVRVRAGVDSRWVAGTPLCVLYWMAGRWSRDDETQGEIEAGMARFATAREAGAVEEEQRAALGPKPGGYIESKAVFGVDSLTRLAAASKSADAATRSLRKIANPDDPGRHIPFSAVGVPHVGYIVKFRDTADGVAVDVLSPTSVG